MAEGRRRTAEDNDELIKLVGLNRLIRLINVKIKVVILPRTDTEFHGIKDGMDSYFYNCFLDRIYRICFFFLSFLKKLRKHHRLRRKILCKLRNLSLTMYSFYIWSLKFNMQFQNVITNWLHRNQISNISLKDELTIHYSPEAIGFDHFRPGNGQKKT